MELRIPDYIFDSLKEKNIEFKEVERLEDVMPELEVLYMTRVQRERFFNEEDYIRLKDSYILDAPKMELAQNDMIVLHPLPRVNEIAVEVDSDPRACYFKPSKIRRIYSDGPDHQTTGIGGMSHVKRRQPDHRNCH